MTTPSAAALMTSRVAVIITIALIVCVVAPCVGRTLPPAPEPAMSEDITDDILVSHENLPGMLKIIFFVAQASYFGLAAACTRHTTTWKHPWGEKTVISTSCLVVALSFAQMLLIHWTGANGIRSEWRLALLVIMPTDLLLPVMTYWCYRILGGLGSMRVAMRRETAKWEEWPGNRVRYLQLTFVQAFTSQSSAAYCSTVCFLCAAAGVANAAGVTFLQFYHLSLLTVRGVYFPLWSTVLVTLLSAILGAMPERETLDSICSRTKTLVTGDQLTIPVLSSFTSTSIIVLNYNRWSDEIKLERFSAHLRWTPFKFSSSGATSEHQAAMDALIAPPAPARKADGSASDNTAAFVQQFKETFSRLIKFFTHYANSHIISTKFAITLATRRHHILDDLRVFDGTSSKMAAQALVLITTLFRKLVADKRLFVKDGKYAEDVDGNKKLKDSDGNEIDDMECTEELTSVAELLAWGFSELGARGTPPAQGGNAPQPPQPRFTAAQLPGFKLKDAKEQPYDMKQLDQMVHDLSHKERNDVMLFLLLERMARLKDNRLVQLDTLCGGKDATVTIGPRGVIGDPEQRPWSDDKRIVTELKDTSNPTWDERRQNSAFVPLQADPEYKHPKKATKKGKEFIINPFDRVSAVQVPVAWNAFWVNYQHVLACLLAYKGASIAFILLDTVLTKNVIA